MNNEEKILEILERLTKEVGKHSEVLETLTGKVDRQGEILAQHSEILGQHSKMLAQHSEMLARHNEVLEELDGRSLRTAVILENEVLPKLQLLYEGQVHLQETLAPKERVEVLEDEVITLKSTVKLMMKRLDALEKAQ